MWCRGSGLEGWETIGEQGRWLTSVSVMCLYERDSRPSGVMGDAGEQSNNMIEVHHDSRVSFYPVCREQTMNKEDDFDKGLFRAKCLIKKK